MEPIDRCWIADASLDIAFGRRWPVASEVELRAIGDGPPIAVIRRATSARGSIEVSDLEGRTLPATTGSDVTVAAHDFHVGPRSFWQAHRDAPALLTDAVVAGAQLQSGDRVVDLFSGVGLFAVALAGLVGSGGRVDAVESSPHAIEDLRANTARYRHARVRPWRVAPRAVNDLVHGDTVVVADPPRTGLGRDVATAIARRAPRRLVYVSCDSATFARDLEILRRGPLELTDLRAIDLFPMTEHIELVGVLDAST
jgi:tRNA/tmRNA/rRNA uracil-C5-methylase (TrmA/RlmC/RlmD family)